MTIVRVLVAYESVMGNTRRVAEAIAAGLDRSASARSPVHVECVQAGRLSTELPEVDLLVLGAPTHFLGLPGERTRQLWVRGVVEATRRGGEGGPRLLEPGSTGPGLREFLAELPNGEVGRPPLHQPLAAAFDTRLARPLAGGAARTIARCLRRHGYALMLPPEGFLVTEISGPVRPGELDRAEGWGYVLGSRCAATAAS